MIITSTTLRNRIKELWNIRDIWLLDPKYFLLDSSIVERIIKDLSNKKMKFTDNVWDCDNYSRLLDAEFKKYQYICAKCSRPDKLNFTWAFGVCMGQRFNGNDINHSVNIALCKQGVYLIEPQTDKIWKADPDRDKLYFIMM